MPSTCIQIGNEVGLHARPAALFVRTAQRFNASISIRNLSQPGGAAVDAKSILGILTLGAAQGHEVLITANGPDEQAALDCLAALVGRNFEEPAPAP
jgi:phosphotransferase system HPr (HPr) family protein